MEEDEDSIASLLDFEVWFVPRSGGGESAHAHASASHQEPSGQPEGDRGGQQPQQQSTEGAQPSQVNEESQAPPSGRPTRGKRRGGRARGGRSGSAGRQPASKKGSDAADAEEEEEGPAKRARMEESTPKNQGLTTPGTVVVRTTRLALCARSKVLRPILTACKDQTKLDVPYDSQEHLEAGKAVVQLLQDLTLPPELQKLDPATLAPSLLVQMCRWAVYWDAPAVVEECLERLSCCELEVLSAAEMNCILELPCAIHTMPQYTKVKERCAAWLLRSYSDVPRIIADDALRACFCSELSFAAVALWAAQDGLTVRSENEVAVLLSFWYVAQDSVSNEEAAELSGLVHVGQFHKSFRHFVLPKLPWFKPPVSVGGFSLAFENGGGAAASDLYVEEIPAAWLAPARRGKPAPGDAALTLAFPKAHLASMLARVATTGKIGSSESSRQPYSGYYFCLLLELDPYGALGVYVSMKSSADEVIPAPEAVSLSYSIRHVQASAVETHVAGASGTWIDVSSGSGRGFSDAFKGTAFRSIEDFAPFLVDGELVFKCEVNNFM